MKSKEQNSSNSSTNKGDAQKKSPNGKSLPVSTLPERIVSDTDMFTPIVAVDSTVADIVLVDGAEATKVARPTLSIYKDQATGIILGVSMQPPMRPDLAGIVEKVFSQEKSAMKWIDGKE